MTTYVKQVGSTGASGSLRNIHKHPFHTQVPQYQSENIHHITISMLTQKIEKFVHSFIQETIHTYPHLKEKPKTLQNRLFKDPQYLGYLKELEKKIDQTIWK